MTNSIKLVSDERVSSESSAVSVFENGVATEILAGLAQTPKRIAPKYFYDQRGSELFDAITRLDEYYLPTAEQHIFDQFRSEICAQIGAGKTIVEPGAGSCEKIRWLLPELALKEYRPMDISAEHLASSAAVLRSDYPELRVVPIVCDHSGGLDSPEMRALPGPVFFYPGSSIGNFEPEAVVQFLASMRGAMDQDGGLLIGVDAKKDPDILHAAYNDRDGLTAAFNLNILSHLNVCAGAEFDTDNFEHVALYSEPAGRIEMHLRSHVDQDVQVAGHTVYFKRGELTHTENSYKYDPHEFVELAAQAGLGASHIWQDESRFFTLLYLTPG